MQTMLLFFLLLLLTDGVSGAETNETESVMEGDSVTLHTDITEIQNDDTILWLFGPKESVISQITRKADFTSFFVTDDMRFRGRLQVDQKTGSLTIRNTRIRHSGKYKLTISREKTRYKIYIVTVYGVVGETDEVKSESVMEGKSVTLQNNVEVQRDDLIVWRFGDKGILLAKIDVETKEISLNDADERFKDRLQLNQNGSLTIKKTKTENAGLYGLQIRGRESAQRFLLSVSAVGDPGLSPGVIAGIVVAALLGLGAVVVYYRCKISELKKQMVEDTKSRRESVIEGQSITLPTDLTELQKDDKIKWWYQDESNLIAEINKETNHSSRCGGTDGRFRGKLKLYDNGNLQITDIRTIHSGLYKLEIHNNRRTKYKNFIVSVSVKTQSVKEGGSVLLETTATIQRGDLLLWMFGAEKSLVATNATWPDTTDERFAGRVELNKKNGWLTIRNVRRTDTGHYKLQIINSKQTTCRRFNVDVTDSTGSQGNDSLTVVTPLLKDDVAGGEEELDELVFVEMLNR